MYQGAMVLLYNLKVDSVIALEMLCDSLDLKYVHIAPAEYLQPIGALAEISGVARTEEVYEGPGFSETMIVMKNFTAVAMNDFLDRMKRTRGIYEIDLRAIVTPNNLRWNSLQLREELAAEKKKIEQAEAVEEQGQEAPAAQQEVPEGE